MSEQEHIMDEVRKLLRQHYPHGAWRRPDGSYFRAVPLDTQVGPEANAAGDCGDRYVTLREMSEAATAQARERGQGERVAELEDALRQIVADAEQMQGLGMREEAFDTFEVIRRDALAALAGDEGYQPGCICIKGNDPTLTTSAVVDCAVHGAAAPSEGGEQ